MSAARKTTKPSKTKPCDCIAQANKLLAERNNVLVTTIPLFKGQVAKVTLATMLKEKKRGTRPVTFLGSYCPMCGQKYNDTDDKRPMLVP